MNASRYNYVTVVNSHDHRRIGMRYYGCSSTCEQCQLWKTPGNVWKAFELYPIHCHFCENIMREDEPELIGNQLVCEKCMAVEVRKRLFYLPYTKYMSYTMAQKKFRWRQGGRALLD